MAVLDFVPTEADIEKAKDFSRQLAREFSDESKVTIQKEGDGESIAVPHSVFEVLMKVLAVMSEGKAFSLLPVDAELTTQQAADMLNVSRPFLINLLEVGEIPHRKVGRHRRITLGDLVKYKDEQAVRSKAALDELAKEAQELNLGY